MSLQLIKEQKKVLRSLFKEKRSILSIEERKHFSEKIADGFLSLKEFASADVICSYASFGDEVSTAKVNETLLSMKKILLLPRIYGERSMHMIQVSNETKYDVNAFGIQEPIGKPYIIQDVPTVLCIMPLLAYDEQGHRLGYGGGFYDVFLDQHPHIYTVGFAFSTQLSKETLPIDMHDHIPDCIIDEHGIRYSTKKPA